uniref:Pyroglutamyl-peptidase I n=1 Tax=Tetraselmis chuii TaxID=63592 RepID=A0A7S1SU77_9CHLO|mmetsp:Transcript_29933/g.53571  ORF Transcript_29933/g.53571 Transcript_29933/m.53571 type:complete len:221 (+) Transcript_29933:118-780(+)
MGFVVTGFSRFSDVVDNPTEWITQNLGRYLSDRRSTAKVDGYKVLRVSAKSTRHWIQEQLGRDCSQVGVASAPAERVIMIHLGLNVTTRHFDLERMAYNCADFRCPDEDGWEPKEKLIEDNHARTIGSSRQTTLPLDNVAARLKGRGHPVHVSTDPGRFVCNWIYYCSLMEQDSPAKPWQSLFLHVPSFKYISAEDQLKFVADLLEDIQAEVEREAVPAL